MNSFRKILILLVVATIFPCLVFAQTQAQTRPAGSPAPENIGVTSAQQRLKEVSVTKFENPGFFRTFMSHDDGFVTMRRLRGSPLGKVPIEDEVRHGINEQDIYVIGLKVEYLRRGVHSFALLPTRPIPIPGITKTLSVWVAGRNSDHTLSILLLDYNNQHKELVVGRLNFSGWRRLTVAVPPEIVQQDFRTTNLQGIKFNGFRVDCDLLDTWGVYYIYFDDLRAVTDLFAEESRDIDDMRDGW
ncbi:MAG: flagellar filament outer layer protein FlaA [Spirochaetaceae bacterium]|nr:flagellar filament outer layer protein FlaA [Spirochaetaceae bacterium]